MKKPKVFVNKIDHKLNNNEQVFSSFRSESKEKIDDLHLDIRKKLKDIFNSPKYVYKADTIIQTKNGSLEKTIVGMNNSELLTIDNEKIKIADITDINLKK